MEDDQLAEIYYERENEYTLAGSVYKGRVTRVLPGMQSAFVDVGLERDAFLYVTDFLEMEDQEDTDEVEKATTQGTPIRQQPAQTAPPPPQQAQNQPQTGRGDGRGSRSGREDRPGRGEARPAAVPEDAGHSVRQPPLALPVAEAMLPASVVEATEQQDETDEQGNRRFRGRRRRRGGRGRDESVTAKPAGLTGEPGDQGDPTDFSESEPPGNLLIEFNELEEQEELEPPPMEFEAAAFSAPRPLPAAYREAMEEPVSAPATSAGPAPFLLPGESLSKYGATVVKPQPSRLVLQELPPDTAPPPPERTVTKPSTLIEQEFVWDGKGLLPGESIARHRASAPPPASVRPAAPTPARRGYVDAEPTGVFADTAPSHSSGIPLEPEAVVVEFAAGPEEELAEFVEVVPDVDAASEDEDEADDFDAIEAMEEFEFEESEDPEIAESAIEPGGAREHDAHGEIAPSHEAIDAHHEKAADHDADATATHNVDPLPPSAFRITDLFGKRKKEEPPAPEPPPAPKPARAVSTYAPGAGHLEEELIEEEEYEFSPIKAHHHDEHDHDNLEEETIQQQIRSGALGEMLHEAQIDSRLKIESSDDEDSDEDEEGAPAVTSGRGQGGQGQAGRGDRGRGGRGRGRDGRGDGRAGDSRGGDRGTSGTGAPSGERGRGPSRRSAQTSDLPIISDLLKPGQEILVQIAKEPIAKKGARITSHIALPGRFLVFMPTVSHVGVSRKIESDEERQRLKRILVSEKGDAQGGFIVRTAAEGASEDELRSDLRFLINLWSEIKTRADSSKPPALIYHDLNLIERILRDQVSDNFSHIWVDSEADYERIVRFLNRFSPDLVRRVKLYTKEVPLFEHFGIQEEISKALRSKVWLKSGGSIVINQTEALVAIDINTGKFVGKTARLEDTILKTNLDAIPEIVRQVRLRDLGGIIVIDFIDMDERKNRARVLAALEEALKQDRAPTKVLQFNDFGLVAITRKRVKQSLERTLSVPCPVCQATGMVKSPATVANEIYIEMRKMRKHFDQSEVLLRVNPETVKTLKANNARWVVDLEELAGRNVLIKSDATLHPEQFDIQG